MTENGVSGKSKLAGRDVEPHLVPHGLLSVRGLPREYWFVGGVDGPEFKKESEPRSPLSNGIY